ncbi:unnamed protein product [Calicophoron daubneyi]|uniref:P-type domain-containing protein n=1 Tax=Calicophoron daubneyi TaxID=300641 RepID=A0AAV2TLM6_CALDB
MIRSFALFTFYLTLTIVSGEDRSCSADLERRLDCYPEGDGTESDCTKRGCCWDSAVEVEIPKCYYPKFSTPAFKVLSKLPTEDGYKYVLKRNRSHIGIDQFDKITVQVIFETNTRLRIRFSSPDQSDPWVPPVVLEKPEKVNPDNTQYSVSVEDSGIQILRKSEPLKVLAECSDYEAESLIISNQFLQISFTINAARGFGPGELRLPYPLPLKSRMRNGLYTRDIFPKNNTNLYGVHNFMMYFSQNGEAFGMFLLNSNAQEVVLVPHPTLTYRTIGGILDFFIFTGPTPADVIAQYYDLVGHPPVPPYWSLGFQLCRWGYKSLNEVSTVVRRNREAGIPLDVQWIDIDYMDRYKIWTVNKEKFGQLGEYTSQILHEKYGMKLVLIIDPAVSTAADYTPYIEGQKLDLFIKDNRTGKPLIGEVWPGETVYPDFSHPKAPQWMLADATRYHKEVPFDGLWIDMNEPSNFKEGSSTRCDNKNTYDNPPYIPKILDRSLYVKTICPSAKHYDTSHYNRHNLYGYNHAQVSRYVLEQLFPGKRSFLLSRSTFAGSGRYTSHWTGDNAATWEDMRQSIPQILNFNMYGIPQVGADICGFNANATEEMCVRWSQLGAFYPFSRNHNSLGFRDQDPAAWSTTAISAIRAAFEMRYKILPYLYTLFFKSHFNGTTVARPLVFEYPQDPKTYDLNAQFMLGSSLMIVPVLEDGARSVDCYIPSGEWYNLFTGERIRGTGSHMQLDAPFHRIPVLVRGGSVIPLQNSTETTSIARKKGFDLLVVLSGLDDGCASEGQEIVATGELFWDDGESRPLDYTHLQITVSKRTLYVVSLHKMNTASSNAEMRLNKLIINGLGKKPTSVHINNASVAFSYAPGNRTAEVFCPAGIVLEGGLSARWSFNKASSVQISLSLCITSTVSVLYLIR